jgi:hypothetical protein
MWWYYMFGEQWYSNFGHGLYTSATRTIIWIIVYSVMDFQMCWSMCFDSVISGSLFICSAFELRCSGLLGLFYVSYSIIYPEIMCREEY